MSQRFQSITVDLAKLRDYCLSDTHPRGRHKARVFRARLGLTSADAEFFRDTLIKAVESHADSLAPTDSDEYGQRYVLDFDMTTSNGTAVIRSAWIVLVGEDVLRLVTCYVL